MRLTTEQKRAALSRRPGAQLVRVANSWACVWGQAPGERWRGQLVHHVEERLDLVVELATWWDGPEQAAKTRGALLQLLRAEVLA